MSISQFSNRTELAILNWLCTNTPENQENARPIAWYLGLSLTVPNTTGGGATEPVGNGYARQSITFSPASGNPGQCTNINPLSFTATGGDWGTVVYSIVYDALTVGHVLGLGPLQTPTLIQNGNNLTYPSGTLAVNLL